MYTQNVNRSCKQHHQKLNAIRLTQNQPNIIIIIIISLRICSQRAIYTCFGSVLEFPAPKTQTSSSVRHVLLDEWHILRSETQYTIRSEWVSD